MKLLRPKLWSGLMVCLLALQATGQTAEDRMAAVKTKLAKLDNDTITELLRQADRDPDPAIRRFILDRVGRIRLPEARAALERHAATDPDATVALAALERLRKEQAQDLNLLLEKRLELARSGKDKKAIDKLTSEHQRWVTLARGAIVPSFLQEPPPVIQATATKQSVRVLVIGDFGREGPNQTKSGAAMKAYHLRRPFDFGISLGDNFEPDGVSSPADSRWKGGWQDVFDPIGIPIYATTGNHDWGFADSPAAEILYSDKSASWRMPALYYSVAAGPVQFFALATQAMSETQLKWVDRELGRSNARWKIVFGHHPIYTYGTHGPMAVLEESLLPLLRNRADIYFAGHEHSIQHLKADGGVNFFVGAASGQDPRPAKKGDLTLFTDYFYGFAVLDIDRERIGVSYVDFNGETQYTTEVRKAR